ncbi:MAG: hypothetical protein KC583_23540, partial [Myxococcales bacterium]|nr:hypothetical protein [Myxococcales bacterium]
MSSRGLLPCVCGLMLGCGDALPPASYQGDAVYAHPLVVVTGVPPVQGGLRLALFWMAEGVDGAPSDVIEQIETGRPAHVGTGPLRVFDRPDAALWARLTADGRGYAIGRFALYVDTNGNGRRDADEALVGDSTHALVYAPEALTADASPSGRALSAGFHKTELPFACAPSPAPSSADCDIALGAACLREEVCGAQGT